MGGRTPWCARPRNGQARRRLLQIRVPREHGVAGKTQPVRQQQHQGVQHHEQGLLEERAHGLQGEGPGAAAPVTLGEGAGITTTTSARPAMGDEASMVKSTMAAPRSRAFFAMETSEAVRPDRTHYE